MGLSKPRYVPLRFAGVAVNILFFFFNFFFPRNQMVPDAAAYYVSSVLQTVNSPYIDGTFTDDGM